MYIWFFICVLAAIAIITLHFLSVAHLKLQEKYGKKKGIRIGEVFGLVSGWGFFISWVGIWVSPQGRFTIPIFENLSISIPIVNSSIPLLHLIIATVLLIPSVWLGLGGIREITLKAAETHRTDRIFTSGVYSIVRHPQYLGGLLAHLGISIIVSGLYSLFSTPLIFVLIYLISWKEEKELIREFGKEYVVYKKEVPMLIPCFINKKNKGK